ncbi:MAG: hypothetical protein ABEJ72_01335, partial [Candidatus Aenigmatarchaeota archaeon]
FKRNKFDFILDTMTGEHEGKENLTEETKDLERARQSLIEELEAINWYQERIENARNQELKEILEHNRDEEKEHVAMLMEWIRENDSEQDHMFEEHD